MKKRDLINSLLGIALLCFTSLWTAATTAQGVIADESNDRWRSTLYLYLWATSLDGTAAVRGNEVMCTDTRL